MADDFDAIVVGAGFAGASAAIRLAQGGASVLLLERGADPGAKNLSGGILWGHDLDAILPKWREEMPLERPIVRKRFGFLTKERAVSFDYSDAAWGRPPYVAHSVLRARTDAWLAKQAEAAGAQVVSGVPVEKLAWSGTKVTGVVQGGETMSAPITILADGANSRLALGTPIRPNPRLDGNATELGMKEVFEMPSAQIEERFNVGPNAGHAEEWVPGFLPKGVMGGGFLYTNRDTVSVGLIVNIQSLFGRSARAPDLIEAFRLHPAIADRLGGAKLVEYGAKLISSGWASRPTAFSGDGWMVAGDAAGFVFSNGLVIQGMNYAVRSGLAAAETALAAKKAARTGAARLSGYGQLLESSGVLADFRGFAGMDRVKWNERFYGAYPALVAELMHGLMNQAEGPKRRGRTVVNAARRAAGVSRLRLLRDGYSLYRQL